MPQAVLCCLLNQLVYFDALIIILLFLTDISPTFTNKVMSATLHTSLDQNTIPQCNFLRYSRVIFSSAFHAPPRISLLKEPQAGEAVRARCVLICINPTLNHVTDDGSVKLTFIKGIFASLALSFWHMFGYFFFAWPVKYFSKFPPLPKQLSYRAFYCNFLSKSVQLTTIALTSANIFQTWSN